MPQPFQPGPDLDKATPCALPGRRADNGAQGGHASRLHAMTAFRWASVQEWRCASGWTNRRICQRHSPRAASGRPTRDGPRRRCRWPERRGARPTDPAFRSWARYRGRTVRGRGRRRRHGLGGHAHARRRASDGSRGVSPCRGGGGRDGAAAGAVVRPVTTPQTWSRTTRSSWWCRGPTGALRPPGSNDRPPTSHAAVLGDSAGQRR